MLVAVGCVVAVATGCSGSEKSATSTVPVELQIPEVTSAPTASTVATTTAPAVVVNYVTEGATVVVANASISNGAAGRMTDRLAAVGYNMGPATSRAANISPLEVTEIYVAVGDDAAVAVATSLIPALGLSNVELKEVGVPAPTENGEMGPATVLILMGKDIADKSLDELQGVTTTTVAATPTTVAATPTTAAGTPPATTAAP